jgi:hypothetical protein
MSKQTEIPDGLFKQLLHEKGINIIFTVSQYYSNLIVWKYTVYKTQERQVFDCTERLVSFL